MVVVTPKYIAKHAIFMAPHVRLKVQTDQMLCERQHLCLHPGVVPLSSGPRMGTEQCAMRDSARDRQEHVETHIPTHTHLPRSPPSPPLLSPTDTPLCPCPRIHTLPALLTLRLIFQPPASASIFAVAVVLTAAV